MYRWKKKPKTKNHKHRKQTNRKPQLGWKKAILTKKPRGNLKRGEFLISIFNPVKNYFVFSFLETNYSLRAGNCNETLEKQNRMGRKQAILTQDSTRTSQHVKHSDLNLVCSVISSQIVPRFPKHRKKIKKKKFYIVSQSSCVFIYYYLQPKSEC